MAAILAIRDRDPDLGLRTAERWRRLVARLTREDGNGWPGADAELTWLARDVAIAAPPEKIGSIHDALRNWGWTATLQMPASNPAAPQANGLDQFQELVSTLTRSLNEMAEQVRVYRDAAHGFERLPASVQELLSRGDLLDYDLTAVETVPGVSVISLVMEKRE